MSHARDLAGLQIYLTDDIAVKEQFMDSDTVVSSALKTLAASTGTKGFATPDDLPAGATAGAQAYVTSNSRLYISNGSGWYNIALINQTPYFTTSPNASYTLDKTGIATVVTILGADSDGHDIPQYSAAGDSGFNTIATVTKDSDNGRVFVIRSIDSDGSASKTDGSGTLTFTLSDGKDSVTANSTFSIVFGVSWAAISAAGLLNGSGTVNDSTANWGSGIRMSRDGSTVLMFTSNGNNDSIGLEQYFQIMSVDPTTMALTKLDGGMVLPNYQIGYANGAVSKNVMVIANHEHYPPNNSYPNGSNAGFCKIYDRDSDNGSTWTLNHTVTGSSSTARLAASTAVSQKIGTKHWVVMGEAQISGNTGKFRVSYGNNGTWSTSQFTPQSVAASRPGASGVAIDGQGERVAIGADTYPISDDGNGNQRGGIEIWSRSGDNSWSFEALLEKTPNVAGTKIGTGVSMDSDGATLVSCCNGASWLSNYDFSMVVFTRSGTTWSQAAVIAEDSDGAKFTGAKISGDGQYIIVNIGSRNDLIRVYQRDNAAGTSWSLKESISRASINAQSITPALPSTHGFQVGDINLKGDIIAGSTSNGTSSNTGVYIIKG